MSRVSKNRRRVLIFCNVNFMLEWRLLSKLWNFVSWSSDRVKKRKQSSRNLLKLASRYVLKSESKSFSDCSYIFSSRYAKTSVA